MTCDTGPKPRSDAHNNGKQADTVFRRISNLDFMTSYHSILQKKTFDISELVRSWWTPGKGTARASPTSFPGASELVSNRAPKEQQQVVVELAREAHPLGRLVDPGLAGVHDGRDDCVVEPGPF